MLNKDRKEYYFNETMNTYSDTTLYNVRGMFQRAGENEDQIGKDICDWSVDDISDYFRLMNSTSVNTLRNFISQFSIYTNWCINTHLSKININNYDNISESILKQSINVGLAKHQFLDRDDLIIRIETSLINDCDKFIILGMFEGIGVDFDELVYTKLDLDGNVLKLYGGREIEISTRLREYAKLSAQSEFYYQEGRKGIDGYVKRRKNPEVDTIVGEPLGLIKEPDKWVQGRIFRISKKLDLKTLNRMKYIRAGRCYVVKENAKKDGVPILEWEISHKDELDKKFGRMAPSTYIEYKKMLTNI